MAVIEEPVLMSRDGAVAVLTFNRPERLNAWSDALEDTYFQHLREAEHDPDIRAIVVTGQGRAFCAGADLESLRDAAAQTDSGLAAERRRELPLTIRKPMIAAVNGAAAGLGLVQALFCDIRFVTPNAKLTTAFARRGLTAENGSAWLLSRTIGAGRAADLLLSGRVITGEEAFRIGLADRLIESDQLLDAAIDYAQDLARHSSPWSMAQIKRQLATALGSTLAQALDEANICMHASLKNADSTEGVASYLERRDPVFPGLGGE